MKILDRIRTRLGLSILPKELKRNPDQMQNLIGGTFLFSTDRSPPKRGTAELLDAYEQMPWLRAIVGKISQAVGTTQWRLFVSRDAEGKSIRNPQLQYAPVHKRHAIIRRQELYHQTKARIIYSLDEVMDHPLLDLLRNGNPYLLGQTVFQVTQQHLDLVGEAFWLLERNQLGVPIAVYPIPPDWVMEKPIYSNPYYRLQLDGRQHEVPVTEMICFIDPNPAEPYKRGSGISRSLADELDTDEFAAKHLRSYFFNRARPDLIISAQGLKKEETQRLEESWMQKNQGFWNAFKPYFINRKIDVKEIGQTFEQMQITQLRKHERDMFLSVFGLPPEKMGVLTASNRCHDKDTEYLTKTKGWVKFENLELTDEIATFDFSNEEIVYQKPQKLIRYRYCGRMYHWHSKSMDVMVTPNHTMYFRPVRPDKTWEKSSSAQLADVAKNGTRLEWRLAGGGYKGTVDVSDSIQIAYIDDGTAFDGGNETLSFKAVDFARFLAAWVCDGAVDRNFSKQYEISFVSKVKKVNETLVHIIKALGIEPEVRTVRKMVVNDTSYAFNCISFCHRSLYYWLTDNCGMDTDERHLPEMVFDWGAPLQRELLQSLIDFDGWWRHERGDFCGASFSSTSKKLVDQVQQLAVNIGIRCSVRMLKQYSNNKASYRAFFSKKPNYMFRIGEGSFSLSEVEYDDYVTCVQVPNGTVVTRRNGRVAIHGNSTIDASDTFWQRDVIMPRVELIRNVLQKHLVPMFDERLLLDFESPVVEDSSFALDVMRAMPGAFTKNEWRQLANRDSLGEDGDVFIMRPGEIIVPLEGQQQNNASNQRALDPERITEKVMKRLENKLGVKIKK